MLSKNNRKLIDAQHFQPWCILYFIVVGYFLHHVALMYFVFYCLRVLSAPRSYFFGNTKVHYFFVFYVSEKQATFCNWVRKRKYRHEQTVIRKQSSHLKSNITLIAIWANGCHPPSIDFHTSPTKATANICFINKRLQYRRKYSDHKKSNAKEYNINNSTDQWAVNEHVKRTTTLHSTCYTNHACLHLDVVYVSNDYCMWR